MISKKRTELKKKNVANYLNTIRSKKNDINGRTPGIPFLSAKQG